MHDFTILVLRGTYPTSLAVTIDILSAAASMARRMGGSPPTWRLCSHDGAPTPLQSGMSVATSRLPKRATSDSSIWIVPGLGLNKPAAIPPRFAADDARQLIDALRKHAASGGRTAASCSGVFMLQAAGLLVDRRATTSWWLAPELQRLEPRCRVDSDRMVCADGAIVTAGAAFGQIDLMLHLVRARCGNAVAEAVCRVLLIDGRQAQAAYVIPEAFSSGDDLVGRIAARVESALPDVPTVGALAREFCVSERTLSRHIRKVTGKSTLALVQSVKHRRARALLESSRLSVEQVASAVGYQDATALRRLMRKVAGANPSRFRPAVAIG